MTCSAKSTQFNPDSATTPLPKQKKYGKVLNLQKRSCFILSLPCMTGVRISLRSFLIPSGVTKAVSKSFPLTHSPFTYTSYLPQGPLQRSRETDPINVQAVKRSQLPDDYHEKRIHVQS